MKPTRKQNPTLAAAWDQYGHSIDWDALFDAKFGSHGFVALAWMEEGLVNYATLSHVGNDWEMQNDSHDAVPLATWKKMRVKPDCDWLEERP